MEVKYELSDMDKMGITKHVKLFIVYALQPTANQDHLVSCVKEGVKNATRQLPIMAGRLEIGSSGRPYIVTTPESEVKVSVRHFQPPEHKPLSALSSSAYAPNTLDPTLLLPSDEELAATNPACALQLTFIEGGLILGFRMNHGVGDWVSMDRFLSLVCQSSKAWHEGATEMPTCTADLNRTPYNASPTDETAISREEKLAHLPVFHILEKSQFKPSMPPPFEARMYQISELQTQQIKAQCSPHLDDGVDYISSYDCISALMWTAITRARIQLHPEKASLETRLVHPIDVRSRDPEKKTSVEYFGNAVIGSLAGPVSVQEFATEDNERGLAKAASLVRKSINAVSLSTISHMTSLLTSLPPTEMLLPKANFADMDLFMNTWYSGSADKYVIGAESAPVAFRPHAPVPGSCVILPNFSQGPTRVFDVCLQLAVDEHELLRKDAEFRRHFEVVA